MDRSLVVLLNLPKLLLSSYHFSFKAFSILSSCVSKTERLLGCLFTSNEVIICLTKVFCSSMQCMPEH